MMYFKVTMQVRGKEYKASGVQRKWNPLDGVNLEEYPLPSAEVFEIYCANADGIVTWGTTQKEAIDKMEEAIERWLDR